MMPLVGRMKQLGGGISELMERKRRKTRLNLLNFIKNSSFFVRIVV